MCYLHLKTIDLQIMQRKCQVLPHNLSCSFRLSRKPLTFITTSQVFGLRHFSCIALVV